MIEATSHQRHGHTSGDGRRTPEYLTWQGMVQRCTNPQAPRFKRYGGRGISICERWLFFPAFLADMGRRPPGTTLDRIDNSRGYEPGNCRWATWRVQGQNRTSVHLLTINGETLCLAEWGRRIGLTATALRLRLHRGLTGEGLLSPPRRDRASAGSAGGNRRWRERNARRTA